MSYADELARWAAGGYSGQERAALANGYRFPEELGEEQDFTEEASESKWSQNNLDRIERSAPGMSMTLVVASRDGTYRVPNKDNSAGYVVGYIMR